MEKCNSADGVIQAAGSPNENSTDVLNRANIGHLSLMSRSSFDHVTNHKQNTQSLPRINANNGFRGVQRVLVHSRTASLTRDGSVDGYFANRYDARKQFEEEEEAITPTDDRSPPPPKPIRSMMNLRHHDSTMTLKDLPLDIGPLNRVVTYHASGSDSGNGSGDSAQSSAANDSVDGMMLQHQRVGGVFIRNPRFLPNSASSQTLKSFADLDYQAIENSLMTSEIAEPKQTSKFDLENFHTLLLPSIENRPLDSDALNTVRIMLSETAPRVIANHMSRIDIALILGDLNKTNEQSDDILNNCCGTELITLSHGQHFRKDLIERTECIRLLVAVTVLTSADDPEKADTINKWIQIANDAKTALGNLYGFTNIMLGLCMPQVIFYLNFHLLNINNIFQWICFLICFRSKNWKILGTYYGKSILIRHSILKQNFGHN